ncbi:MAG: hypothetical protein H7A45_12460 [Verrucomicrobiales bacterium]|nr:hypothetical protein [Verrucomicrobiales bacterium]
MDLPQRERLPHDIPAWVTDGSPFFITISCVPRGLNQLARPGVGDAVLAAAAFNHERRIWSCRIMVLMPDHLHAILACGREPGMKTIMKNWKKFLAVKHGIEWQRDFFDHRLRDHHAETEKLDYILRNPLRRGLVECVEDWPWVYRPKHCPPPPPAG